MFSRQTLTALVSLFHSKGLQQSFFVMVGNVCAAVLSGVGIIIITRVLGPTLFGEFSTAFSLALILNSLSSLGISAVIIKYGSSIKSKPDRNDIFSYTLKIKLFLFLALGLVGQFMTPWLTEVFSFTQPVLLRTAFLTTGVITLYEHFQTIYRATHRFKGVVIASFLQSATKLGLSLVLFAVGVKAPFLFFLVYMISPISAIVAARWLLPYWVTIDLHGATSTTQKLTWSLVKHTALGIMLVGIAENIDTLLVRSYLTAYDTGLLGGVSRISLLLSLAANSLGNVLFSRVARYTDKHDLGTYIRKASLIACLSLLGFILFIPLAALSIQITIGPEYLPAKTSLLILMAAAFMNVAAIPFRALFYSYEQKWYFSTVGIIQVVVIIFGNVLFVPQYGFIASAITELANKTILLTFTLLVGWYGYRKKFATPKQTDQNFSEVSY